MRLQKSHNTHALLILNSLPNIDLQKQIHVSKIKNTLLTINSFALLKMGDTPTCVAAVAKTNSLGFKAPPICCVVSCPAFPLQHVVVCFEVNNSTTVNIEVSCPSDCGEVAPTGWTGISESSWGRTRRTVRFDQFVQSGSFVRITTCANEGICSTSVNCGLGVRDAVRNSYPDAPKLVQFRIDGQDIVSYLATVLLSDTHTDECVYVGCATDSSCCNNELFASLNQIPWGSEITVGPIGNRTWQVASSAACPDIAIIPLPATQNVTTSESSYSFIVSAAPVNFQGTLSYSWEMLIEGSWLPVSLFIGNAQNPLSVISSNWILDQVNYPDPGVQFQIRCLVYSTAGNTAVLSTESVVNFI